MTADDYPHLPEPASPSSLPAPTNMSPPPTTPLTHAFTISDALLADAPSIAKMGAEVWATTFGYSVSASDLAAYLEQVYSIQSVIRDLSDPNMRTLVTRSISGEVIGFTQLRLDSTESCLSHIPDSKIELQRLYVSSSHHGQGIGPALMSAAERVARDEYAVKVIWLGVWEENLRARKVYAKLGFERVGKHDFRIGEEIQTDLVLWKRL